jgi:type I restriction enzyme S subunit
MSKWPIVRFAEILCPNRRPYTLGPTEDADLVGMRLYGGGPFHREHKPAMRIRKKSHYVIHEGDVIYNKLFAWKGAFGIVPAELDGMLASDKFPTYELDESLVARQYLGWYFRLPALWEQARAMSTGTAALSKLTLNPPRFLELDIPLPPLREQRRIVAKIESIDTRTKEAKKLNGNSIRSGTALLGAHLNDLIGRLGELGVLSDVLDGKLRNGWSPRCDNAPGGTPVLSLGAVTGFDYNPREFKRTSLPTDSEATYWLQPGDLLITRSNTPELVGHAAIYDGNPRPCIYPDLMIRVPLDSALADRRFLWYWLQSPLVRQHIRDKAKGTSSTMLKINQKIVKEIPFPVGLSLEIQKKLIVELDSKHSFLADLKQHQASVTTKLDALIASVIDTAFRGEL